MNLSIFCTIKIINILLFYDTSMIAHKSKLMEVIQNKKKITIKRFF